MEPNNFQEAIHESYNHETNSLSTMMQAVLGEDWKFEERFIMKVQRRLHRLERNMGGKFVACANLT